LETVRGSCLLLQALFEKAWLVMLPAGSSSSVASAGQVPARGWRRPLDAPLSALIPRHRIAESHQRDDEEDGAAGGHGGEIASDDV
jgi:hypothetical protein